MADAPSHPRCEICNRHLLPGERLYHYVDPDGTEATVCELCKSRAEAAGWLSEREVAALRERGESPQRRPRRGQLLGGLLARAGEGWERRRRSEEPAAEAAEPRRRPERRRRGAEEQAAATEEPPRRDKRRPVEEPREGPRKPRGRAPGTTLDEALAAFNASENRRIVAGLSRSLGPAQASGLAVRTAAGVPGARLTVAWELAWYQWEVGPGKRAPEIRESGKGETIDQLRAADRTWNLTVGEDGSLATKRASAPAEEQGAETAGGGGAALE